MEQPEHGNGSPGHTALAERPRSLECRNTACHLWAVEVEPRDRHDRCLFCGWQLAPVDAQDIALQTEGDEWAVVDVQEIIARGREVCMRALAIRLTVQRLGHNKPDYWEPCVCDYGRPTPAHAHEDVTDDGGCRYCAGTGRITLGRSACE
jgi:hypothetical protein